MKILNYKIHCYIFLVFAHSEVISQTAERNEKLYPLVSRTSDDSSQPINILQFSSTLLVPFPVLGTPTEGYQKSGTVPFAILVPFTTSDRGN